MSNLQVLITRLDPDLPLPGYAKPGDAGADLYSRIDITLPAGERALIPTGIAIALPPGYAAFVHPRSGMAIKQGMSLVNTPGTIDASYRGEIQVIAINHDLTKAIEIKSDYTFAYNNRASANYKNRDFKAAVNDCNKAIDLNVN